MPNYDCDKNVNCTHFSKINPKDGSPVQDRYDGWETGLLCNLLATDGLPGKVRGRRGEKEGRPVRGEEALWPCSCSDGCVLRVPTDRVC